MHIGTIFAGEVETIDGECIITKFFILGLPLIPISSYYALGRGVNGMNGFEIPPHRLSIVLGYLRFWSFGLAVLFGGWAYFEKQPYLYILAALCLLLLLLSLFRWGKLPKTEILKRTIYKKYTGIYANPDDLPAAEKTRIYGSLMEQWQALADPEQPWTLEPEPWLACHKVLKTDLRHYALAYTMGRYARATEKMDSLWLFIAALITHGCGEL